MKGILHAHLADTQSFCTSVVTLSFSLDRSLFVSVLGVSVFVNSLRSSNSCTMTSVIFVVFFGSTLFVPGYEYSKFVQPAFKCGGCTQIKEATVDGCMIIIRFRLNEEAHKNSSG